MKYGLKRNHEGYADPTVYEALSIKAGELWEKQSGDIVLVIKHHDTFSTVLRMAKEGVVKKEFIEVGGYYTDPRMIAYSFDQMMESYVGCLTKDEFEYVVGQVSGHLEIPIEFYWNDNIESEEEDFEDEQDVSEYISQIEALKAKNELLREMYDDLVLRLVSMK